MYHVWMDVNDIDILRNAQLTTAAIEYGWFGQMALLSHVVA